jgi:DNA/RNA endonuclease YhcR with UshA esterase domain
MKAVLSICMIVAATLVSAAEDPAPLPPAAAVVKGEVLEVKDVESYTYLRLKTRDGETWAAVGKAPVSKGAKVTIENVMVMTNFESKSLKKTFPTILFGSLGGAGGSAPGAGHDMAAAHSGLARTADTGAIHVAKATGANARTVAEIMTKGAELKDKPVLVRAKVVKYNPGIMGKNWVHLRDGSGSAADNTNDVLATTTNPAKTGDVVTVKGVVRTDKDFGSGYSYKVLIEEATLQQ